MKELTIEPVNQHNFSVFLDLIRKLAEYEKLEPPDQAAETRLKRDALSKPPKFHAYLGFLYGEVVGYVIFCMTYSSFLAKPVLYLEDIFVLEKWRRQGMGAQLFNFCLEQASKLGCGKMEWCVLDWNRSAMNFYEKHGARRLPWVFYRLTEEQISQRLARK